MSLLEVKGLSIDYSSGARALAAAHDVSFTLDKGETLGLVGESGSGKSTVARALIRLLPRNGSITNGSIVFARKDVLKMSSRDLRSLRWDRISMIFQGTGNVLDPVFTVGAQIVEAIQQHRPGSSRRDLWNRAEQLLDEVGIDASRARSYPHELSGGMKQRVNIAMAIALEPEIMIADEPTTALDVITQDNVMRRLLSLQQDHESALILISHDMGLIAENCTRIGVMYAGRLVEMGPAQEVLSNPTHPYTMGLINAVPKLEQPRRLVAIPGFPPTGFDRPSGCLFEPRCPFSAPSCTNSPPWIKIGVQHGALCHFAENHKSFQTQAKDAHTWDTELTNETTHELLGES